jgi:hypothetical protein
VTDISPPINSFDGSFAFLSNFFASPIAYGGGVYPTVEHAYQAAMALTPGERLSILFAPTAGRAKRLGRQVQLRPGWDEMRTDVMRQLLRLKFQPGSDLAVKLLATGDAELIEDGAWNDRFWGVCRGAGENRLGKLLMEVRAQLATVSASTHPPPYQSRMLKKAWITPGDGDFCALTLESAEVTPEYRRLSVRESTHPANPTPQHPLRHAIVIPLLSDEDLAAIYRVIGEYLHAS